jgi:hypothetical protein
MRALTAGAVWMRAHSDRVKNGYPDCSGVAWGFAFDIEYKAENGVLAKSQLLNLLCSAKAGALALVIWADKEAPGPLYAVATPVEASGRFGVTATLNGDAWLYDRLADRPGMPEARAMQELLAPVAKGRRKR